MEPLATFVTQFLWFSSSGRRLHTSWSGRGRSSSLQTRGFVSGLPHRCSAPLVWACLSRIYRLESRKSSPSPPQPLISSQQSSRCLLSLVSFAAGSVPGLGLHAYRPERSVNRVLYRSVHRCHRSSRRPVVRPGVRWAVHDCGPRGVPRGLAPVPNSIPRASALGHPLPTR